MPQQSEARTITALNRMMERGCGIPGSAAHATNACAHVFERGARGAARSRAATGRGRRPRAPPRSHSFAQ
eukprot:918812-Pyramimonas_sp.AAC.1